VTLGILLCVLCVVAANAASRRLQMAAPLLLVVIGVAMSLQPWIAIGTFEVEPDHILAGVLPLLLFASAVSMPSTSFRRNFEVISGLSVTLVVLTSLTLGLLFSRVLPGLGWAGGIAIGAVISPTDAVATSIVKKLGAAPRVVAVLDGEAMLNDASALVILRTAVASMGVASVSIGGAIGWFLLSLLIAAAIGIFVGYATLFVRRRIEQPTVNTLLSFAVPFIAYQPAEHAGASGLVAVVAAGLVIGMGAPRFIAPVHRINERLNWRTIEMLLEGGLFLLMGLQLVSLLEVARKNLGLAVGLSAAALGITLAARTVYVVPMLIGAARRRRKYQAARPKLEALRHTPTDAAKQSMAERDNRIVARVQARVRRVLADADYVLTSPLGAREAGLLIWAGMRGAITLAAAETLPATFPHRSLVVLVAFMVASASLILQGGSLAWVVRMLRFPPRDEEAETREREVLSAELEAVAHHVLDDPETMATMEPAMVEMVRSRLVILEQMTNSAEELQRSTVADQIFDAQRNHILHARLEGSHSTESLAEALARVDARQIGLQLTRRGRIGPDGD
jgi:CPA1 family monovalent cation:H+ antiporter